MPPLHGWTGLAIPYAISAGGLLVGLAIGRAPLRTFISVPLIAAATLLATTLLWGPINDSLHGHLPEILVLALGFAFFFLVAAITGRLLAIVPVKNNYKRGTVLDDVPIRLLPKLPTATQTLTLAGLPLDAKDETKHFKFIGTTGTGKSTAIRELLAGVRARGDRAVIADPDGSYLRSFYDPKRGDQILNPFDPRAARWDLFAEIHSPWDADQLAISLIPDAQGPERNWRQYARVFLSAVLRQLHRVNHNDPKELYDLLATTPAEDLRELLSDTPAGPYLSQDNGKFFGAVRAVANTHLSVLEHIAHHANKHHLSVRSWVKTPEPTGSVLFLPYNASEIATLRGLIATWLRLAIFETMTPTPEGQGAHDQRLWFIIDELDALGAIDGLKDALARLRKFGGRCVLGFQSIAQVSTTYGHGEAQTIVENCGNTLILRCSASENGGTARFASKLIGEREVIREQRSESRSGKGFFADDTRSVSTSRQYVTESAVLPSQIEQLPDLEGYLKFASQPEWRRVRLSLPR